MNFITSVQTSDIECDLASTRVYENELEQQLDGLTAENADLRRQLAERSSKGLEELRDKANIIHVDYNQSKIGWMQHQDQIAILLDEFLRGEFHGQTEQPAKAEAKMDVQWNGAGIIYEATTGNYSLSLSALCPGECKWSISQICRDLPTAQQAVEAALAELAGKAKSESSSIPCCNCGGEVIEFTVPNALWNKVIRHDGHATDKEYLCFSCWNQQLSDFISELETQLAELRGLLREVSYDGLPILLATKTEAETRLNGALERESKL
jgi:hypothetical protein